MRMSATCLRSKSRVQQRQRVTGFTLVEILVVLVIVGLLAGISLPRLTTLYASVEQAGQRSALQEQIEGLGYRAYISGQAIVLDSSSAESSSTVARNYPLQLPLGWGIVLPKPIRYSSQGICSGGKLRLRLPNGAQEAFRLNPPLCRLEPGEAD